MTTLYLEQYLDSVQNLPADLHKNLKNMRDLDETTQTNLRQLDALVKGFVVGARGLSKEQRTKNYQSLQELFHATKGLSQDKVSLAKDTYELVDKHIRRLDNDLAKFEDDIKRKLLGSKASNEPDDDPRRKRLVKDKKRGNRKSGIPEKKSKKAHDSNNSIDTPMDATHMSQLSGPALLQQLTGAGMGELDMPVDPNEPTYCTCHQVSYGEMVGCDNVDCPIEWFHFNCVGLHAKPKGKWFCPRCTEERKKKGH